MARRINRLTPKSVASKKRAGYYADGGGLYLQVSSGGSKSWVFRYMLNRKAREMGLGSLREVSLAEARDKAETYRKLARNRIDPIEARKAEETGKALDAARAKSFRECAQAYVKAHRAGWKSAKHVDQWTNTLETYCGPVIGSMPVQAVDTALVMRVLEPIWTEKPETASRLRGRIEKVLDWAKVRGYRTGDNPAILRGHLDKLLPKLEKRKRVVHHPALPYTEIGDFMEELRKQEGVAARALEFLILTVGRTAEVTGSKPDEIDFKRAIWTIPAKRMKAHRAHRVPLAPRALEIARDQQKLGADYLFPGRDPNLPISNMAMLMLLDRMDRADITVHGFRSTFRDWAAEQTSYAREVCEMALAHAVGDQVEAAYRRGDLFEKRRRLMMDWARFCERPQSKGKVVPMRVKASK